MAGARVAPQVSGTVDPGRVRIDTAAGRTDRRRRSDQGLRRRGARGRPAQFHGRSRHGDRVPRPERRRQDDHAASPARARPPHVRHRDDRRAALPPDPPAADRGGRGAGVLELPPGPDRAEPPADPVHRRRPADVTGRRGAPPRRVGRRRAPQGAHLLARHAATARPGRGAARRPTGARARRAGQRPGPGGHPLAAERATCPGRRRPHGPGVQPSAERGRGDRRPRRDPQPWPPGHRRPDRRPRGRNRPCRRPHATARTVAGRGPAAGRPSSPLAPGP